MNINRLIRNIIMERGNMKDFNTFTNVNAKEGFPPLGGGLGGNKNFAFTLAEVLITLGVIGVVAAMTLPSVITHFQKQKTVSQLKKAYTTISQALKMSIIDNGDLNNWDVANYTNSKDYVEKFFKPYLKTIKTCNIRQECGYNNNSSSPWACYGINGNVRCVEYWQDNQKTALVLPDGVHVIFPTFDTYNNVISSPSRSIYIDINGSKGPNAYGKDFFEFSMNDKGLFPAGYDQSENDLKTNCSKDGYKTLCSAKIARDGWKISDDYPW